MLTSTFFLIVVLKTQCYRTTRTSVLPNYKARQVLVKPELHQRTVASTDLTALCSPGTPVRAMPVRRKVKASIRATPVPKPAPSVISSGIPATTAVASGNSSKKAKVKKRTNKQRVDARGPVSCSSTRTQNAPNYIAATSAKAARTFPSAHASVQTDQSVLYLLQRQKTTAKHPMPDKACRTMQPDPVTRKKLDEALHMALSSKQSSAAPSPDPGHLFPPAGSPPVCPQHPAAHKIAGHELQAHTADHVYSPSTRPAALEANQAGARASMRAGPPTAVGMMASYDIWNHPVAASRDHVDPQVEVKNRYSVVQPMMSQDDHSKICGATHFCALMPDQGFLHEACSQFQDSGEHPSCSDLHAAHAGVLNRVKKLIVSVTTWWATGPQLTQRNVYARTSSGTLNLAYPVQLCPGWKIDETSCAEATAEMERVPAPQRGPTIVGELVVAQTSDGSACSPWQLQQTHGAAALHPLADGPMQNDHAEDQYNLAQNCLHADDLQPPAGISAWATTYYQTKRDCSC